MTFAAIKKNLQDFKTAPNLDDYAQTCAGFSWEKIQQEFAENADSRGLNIAYECIDRHAETAHRDHLALRWLGKQGDVRDFTYGDLQRLSSRFANVLQGLGIGPGARAR